MRHGETKVAMLAVSWDTIRLFLHILAATVWVGGQITLAALVPALRRRAAALHARARSRAGLAVFGALTGVSALAAVFLGVLLAG